MTVIAEIATAVTARTSKFEKGMRRSRKALGGFSSSITRSVAKVASFGAALTAVAGGAGLAALTKQAMGSIDATAKLSDRLGLATEELVGFRHAAELTGAGTSTMDAALRRMVRRVGKAAQGSGEATKALEQLGLEAGHLANLGTAEAFRTIADRLQTVEGEFNKTAIASRIFGNEGEALINTMAGGRAGLEEMSAEAARLGMTFSRMDAAKVEAANDAIARMRSMMGGLGQELAIGLAPWLEATAAKVTAIGTSGGGMGEKVSAAIEWVASGIAKVADWLEVAKAGFYALRGVAIGGLGLILKSIHSVGQKVIDLGDLIGIDFGRRSHDAFGAFADGLIAESKRAFEEVEKAHERFHSGAASKAVAESFEKMRKRADEAAESAAKAAKERRSFEGIGEDTKPMAEQAARIEELAAKGRAVIERTRTPMEQYEKTIGDLNELIRHGAIDWDTYGRAVREARADLESTFDRTGEAAGRAKSESDDLRRSIERTHKAAEGTTGRLSRMATSVISPEDAALNDALERARGVRSRADSMLENIRVTGLGRQRQQGVGRDPQLKSIDKKMTELIRTTKRDRGAVLQ